MKNNHRVSLLKRLIIFTSVTRIKFPFMEISMKVKKTPHRSRSMASLNQQTTTVKQKIKNPLSKFTMNDYLPSCSNSVLEFPVVWNELRSNRQLCDGVVKCEQGHEFKVFPFASLKYDKSILLFNF